MPWNLSPAADIGADDAEATLVLKLRPAPDLSARVLRCAQTVHRVLGPGLEDFLYARALGLELAHQAIACQRDAFVVVRYRGEVVGRRRVGFLMDDLAVDVSAERSSAGVDELRRRATALLQSRPVGLALDFGGAYVQASRADSREGKRGEATG
jgi:GxxExxY protein